MCPDIEGITNRQLMRWMFGFLSPVKTTVVLACLYLSLWTAAEVTAVRITAGAVNSIKEVHFSQLHADTGVVAWITGGTQEATALRHIVLLLAATTLGLGVFAYLKEVTNAKLSMNMVFYIREAVYDKLQRAGFGFHDAISTGELINRALSDLQNVRAFVNSAVLVTLEIVLIVGGYLILLLSRSPWVAALSLVPLPLWTWYILQFSKRAQPALKATMKEGDRNISIITENIAGVHVVKAFATQQQEVDKYRASCDSFFAKVMYRIRLFANFAPVMRSIATASHLTLFLAVGVLIIKARLTAGDVLMLGAAMGAILGRLQQVAVINDQYQNAIVSARRLFEVLVAAPSVKQRRDAPPLPDGPGAVRFESVTFGYDPAKPALRDITLEVPGGKVAAIVGPTGAGKTTLVSLVARFYDPQQGRILIDGTDIREVSLDSLRTQVSYVFQETFLFSDTVEANIAYGRPEIRGEMITEAARIAQAHEFIETLPLSYATRLTERGGTLSGGQRQRLAIARAILSTPRVLILDDATSAVDPETEESIRKAMRKGPAHQTTFVIAHRISTVKNADLVIILEEGRITQMGTHEQLLAQEGHYRQVVNLQLHGDVDIDSDEVSLSHMKRMRDFDRRRGKGLRQEEEIAGEPDA